VSDACPSPWQQFSCRDFFVISGVRLSPLGTAATTALLYQPQMIDDGDCGAMVGMKIGRGNRSTRRKPAPAPLCPAQISGRRGGKPATDRLGYGATSAVRMTSCFVLVVSSLWAYVISRPSVGLQLLRESPLVDKAERVSVAVTF
jgi:hypothetical protein